MGIRKRSKTFKNIQKLGENIQKLTRNIRKYSKILQVLAQMVLSGCVRSTMGLALTDWEVLGIKRIAFSG
jgi:hypothetical protein